MLKLKFINFEWFYSNYERIEKTDKNLNFFDINSLLDFEKLYETIYQ